MRILFAVSNEKIAEAIKKEYQSNYKEQLFTKNVYYFNAIIKELQNNKNYDVLIVSEDLEPFANNNYDSIDKFLIDKLSTIREEAINEKGVSFPIIFITTDRHMLGDFLTTKLYEIGIYNALVGNDRSIENVCTLMFHPRKKNEAKNYYRVNTEIENGPKDDEVKEEEIKNILAHYKKLGKAEERYVESFNNIASQYNDAQLKVIIRFLPLNVKAVLETQSPKYQSLTTFANNYNAGMVSNIPHVKKNNELKEKDVNVETTNNRVLEQITSLQNNDNIIIPNNKSTDNVRKINELSDELQENVIVPARRKEDYEETIEKGESENILPGFEEIDLKEENNIETFNKSENIINQDEEVVVKRGRGRPKKNIDPLEKIDEKPKRGRGRPKKNLEITENLIDQNNFLKIENSSIEEENILPELDESSKVNIETNISNIDDDVNVRQKENENNENLTSNIKEKQIINNFKEETLFSNPVEDIQKSNLTSEKASVRYENIEYLIPSDKRIVSFIGTTKSGVSFIVNNLAQILSNLNINVAILDMTKNKNSFYIFTNNNEMLRNRASNSIYGLLEGKSEGLKISKNLTVYTAVPTDTEKFYEADKVLKTLLDNHSVILIDTDFDTPMGYFDNSTDMFIVQNMDILTMQPLTTFLKEIKSKGILKDEKLKVIVNMETKVKGINPQVLLSAISVYKDPGMAYTVDLFDRMAVKLFTIPFEIEAYNKYLTTLVDCNLSLNGYPKNIMESLKEIGTAIYPLLSNNNKKKGSSYTPPSLNNTTSSLFSKNMGDTLNQMKNKY